MRLCSSFDRNGYKIYVVLRTATVLFETCFYAVNRTQGRQCHSLYPSGMCVVMNWVRMRSVGLWRIHHFCRKTCGRNLLRRLRHMWEVSINVAVMVRSRLNLYSGGHTATGFFVMWWWTFRCLLAEYEGNAEVTEFVVSDLHMSDSYYSESCWMWRYKCCSACNGGCCQPQGIRYIKWCTLVVTFKE
jgi:hypothetical protein